MLATKPGDLSSIPISGTHMVEGENACLWSPPYTKTHTHSNVIKNVLKEVSSSQTKLVLLVLIANVFEARMWEMGYLEFLTAFSHYLMNWNLEMSIPSSASSTRTKSSKH